MVRFSANLGFLWKELPLTEAILAAGNAGFEAVEAHWPYDVPAERLKESLSAAGLPMISINKVRGDTGRDENGLTALAGREWEARSAIDQAIAYAAAIDARYVHVLAGTEADGAETTTYVDNIQYAADRAAGQGVGILVEPINQRDMPGYFLRSTGQALDVLEMVGRDNVRIMFDCYHVELIEGAVAQRLEALLPHIGHIQFAAVPTRAEPDTGEVDYRQLFALIDRLGYRAPLGAEYRPRGKTEDGLSWMERLTG